MIVLLAALAALPTTVPPKERVANEIIVTAPGGSIDADDAQVVRRDEWPELGGLLLLLFYFLTAEVRPVSQPFGFDTDELGGSSPTSPTVHRLPSSDELGARRRPADTVLLQQGSQRDDQAAYRSGRSRC